MGFEDPDLALVQALQAGDDGALETLMTRHQNGLFRFIFRHVANEVDAAELTQEAFVRAYFNIHRFRPDAKFVTWLYHIALNLCRDYVRRASARYSQTMFIDAPSEEKQRQPLLSSKQSHPDQQAQDREKLRAVEKAITELPEDLKNPLILTALEGLSHAQTGALLGISPKAVEMKVYRARKLLMEKMKNLGF